MQKASLTVRIQFFHSRALEDLLHSLRHLELHLTIYISSTFQAVKVSQAGYWRLSSIVRGWLDWMEVLQTTPLSPFHKALWDAAVYLTYHLPAPRGAGRWDTESGGAGWMKEAEKATRAFWGVRIEGREGCERRERSYWVTGDAAMTLLWVSSPRRKGSDHLCGGFSSPFLLFSPHLSDWCFIKPPG